ncbi:hypothetical protein BD410DRAFT_842300 [Rickenella mellea]|uniref:Uncharacterized protein n=1 Tax=Rickenella mellea TaxID=50990 RepID=A0A4Y7PXG0_9AGAM|nr:hypothetical protein BD410DRAFT_842300 [Rickenella mellea]
MGLPNGVYTITNIHCWNVAYLPSTDDREQVVGKVPSESDATSTVSNAMSLIPSSDDRYVIRDPKSDRCIRPRFSAQSRAGDAVQASYGSSDPFYWKIIQHADGSYLSNEQGFTCEIEFQGFDPRYVFHFQEPILIEYGHDVIAKSYIPRVRSGQDKPNRLYPVLRIEDWLRFQDLARAVMQEADVTVVLRATGFQCFREGDANFSSDTFTFETRSKLKGFDSFRRGVQLNDVVVLGSKIDGATGRPYLDARAVTVFSSLSMVEIKASMSVDVYYVHASLDPSREPDHYKIGVATIQDLYLTPDRKVRENLEWKFLPPGTELNRDICQFVSKYLTTDEEFELLLHVKDITTNICGHTIVLPDLRKVKATTRGRNSPFVTRSHVYLRAAPSFLFKQTSVTFDVANPVDGPLTILSIESLSSIGDGIQVHLQCRFGSFTVPGPRGETRRSPMISNAKIVKGYWKALRFVIRRLFGLKGPGPV